MTSQAPKSVLSVTGNTSAALPSDLLTFYSLPANFDVLKTVNGSSPPVSLRTVAIYVSLGACESVRRNYVQQLRRFSRKRFDPFRRCDRVKLQRADEELITTEGQMNFFRWLIETGTWNFIVDNAVNVISIAARCVRENVNVSAHPRRTAHKNKTECVPSGVSTLAGRHVVIFD